MWGVASFYWKRSPFLKHIHGSLVPGTRQKDHQEAQKVPFSTRRNRQAKPEFNAGVPLFEDALFGLKGKPRARHPLGPLWTNPCAERNTNLWQFSNQGKHKNNWSSVHPKTGPCTTHRPFDVASRAEVVAELVLIVFIHVAYAAGLYLEESCTDRHGKTLGDHVSAESACI